MSGPLRRILGPPGNATASVVVLLLAVFVAVGASIAYTARAVHRSDQQWCEVLRTLDVPAPSGSPMPDRQRAMAEKFHRLRVGKGC